MSIEVALWFAAVGQIAIVVFTGVWLWYNSPGGGSDDEH